MKSLASVLRACVPVVVALVVVPLCVLGGACSSSSSSSGDVPADTGVVAPLDGDIDSSTPDATLDAPVDGFVPTGMCASTFDGMLTTGFGRIDGTVYAVQKPSDTSCALPNSDHTIIQVLMKGAVYRLVANVQSDRDAGDNRIQVADFVHALPAPAWSEGWHLGAGLDYVTTLGVHSDASFTPLALTDAATKIATEVKVGDLVSIYATVGATEPNSAHLIHRNDPNEDGAIVIHPTTAPSFILFHFSNQTF
jgi:hypothetical protein